MNSKNKTIYSRKFKQLFFILSKILAFFVMPLTWIIGCFVFSGIVKKKKRKKYLFVAGLVLLIVFSNQYISNRVMLWWEPQPIAISSLGEYDVGVVFTGVSKGDKRPNDRVYFEKGADRITHTLQLYNTGKIKHILISGGEGIGSHIQTYAAERLRSFLLMAGVPDSVITVDIQAVNTYENAVNSAEILKRDFAGQRYLLITSAFHMKRARLCLRKQGIEFDTFPTDYFTSRPTLNFDDVFIPKAESIERWQKISSETAGIITYKLMGYL